MAPATQAFYLGLIDFSKTLTLISSKFSYPKDYWFPAPVRSALVLVLVLGFSWAIATPKDFELINPYGWPQFREFFQAALHPDLSPTFLSLTFEAAGTTLSYAILGTLFSILLGSCGALLASKVVFATLFPKGAKLGLDQGVRMLLTLPRSLHEVIWGLLLINIVGLDPIAGIVAIAIPYGAIVAKIFAEILDDTPRDALDSLKQAGSSPSSAILYGLLPRAKLSLISYGFYRFECSLRSAAILGIIGAGGLGYQMMLSLQSLRYSQIWTLFYAIFLLNGSVDCFSAWVRHLLGTPKRLELKTALHSLQQTTDASPRQTLRNLCILGLSTACITTFAWRGLSPHPGKLLNLGIIHEFIGAVQGGTLKPVEFEFLSPIPWLSLQTIAMSILAIAIAASGAFFFSWFAARHYGVRDDASKLTESQKVKVLGAHGLLLFFRAIPSPIWALVMLYIFRPGIVVGAIALGIHNIGVMGRLFSEDIENSDGSTLQPLERAGVSTLQKIAYGVMPAMLRRSLNYAMYRWEVCVRESFILALVGIGGLGTLLKEEISNFNLSKIIVLLMIFSMITLGIEQFNSKLKSIQAD